MEIPNNLKPYKDYLDYLNVKTLEDFIRFYYISLNINKYKWVYRVKFDDYTVRIENRVVTIIDFNKRILIDIDGKLIRLTEDYIYNLLVKMNDDQIKIALSNFGLKLKMKECRYLEVKSKYNDNSFKVLRSKFKKYCEFCYASEVDIGDILIINIKFSQNIGNLVAQSINEGKMLKVDFDQLIEYIDLMKYLLIEF
jgi:hypothetical protein